MSVSTFFTTLKAQIFSFTEQFLSGRCISWEAERMCISSCMTIPCQEKNVEIQKKLKRIKLFSYKNLIFFIIFSPVYSEIYIKIVQFIIY
jgi:hypothetical protein